MKLLLVLLTCIFGITMLAAPTLGAGWQWDASNALGFLAFAGLLYLGVSSTPRMDTKVHQLFGFLVLGISTLHAYWFLLSDAAVIDYVKPGAPLYMWSGIAALIVLSLLIFISLPGYRRYFHKRYASFRLWHRFLAIGVTLAATWHIAASEFYLSAWYQTMLLMVLTLTVVIAGRLPAKRQAITRRDSIAFLAAGSLFATVFVVLRNVAF